MVLHEGKFVATRGYTCKLTREHVQPHEGTKGSGVGYKKQRRCFDETSAYKRENNGVVLKD